MIYSFRLEAIYIVPSTGDATTNGIDDMTRDANDDDIEAKCESQWNICEAFTDAWEIFIRMSNARDVNCDERQLVRGFLRC